MEYWSKFPLLEKQLEKVESIINNETKSRNKLLNKASLELVMSGGKRLRPAFVLLSGSFGKYDEGKITKCAGAIEVLHTATLVHDDIIDKSSLRRGRITVSAEYGVDMAVYTGDFLFTKAILMLAGTVPVERLDILAKAIKTICEGEVDQYVSKYSLNTSVLGYLKRIQRKTGILFAASGALGGYCGECDDDTIKKLTKVGGYFGTAFQIKDDINDFNKSEISSGKPVFKDLREGLVTLPTLYAIMKNKNLKSMIQEFFDKEDNVAEFDEDMLCALVKENGGINDAYKLLLKYTDRARKVLLTLPDNPSRAILLELISSLE